MKHTTVLVTGANGFVGAALLRLLQQSPGFAVRGASRQPPASAIDHVRIGDIGPDTDWSEALRDVDVVVHCAARVHVMNDVAPAESLVRFRHVNVEGTRRLAQQAAAAGVRRFVFVSSVKVNGESTTGRAPYTHDETPAPQDAYGLSKYEAELLLQEIAHRSGMEVVTVRPPLVYGPGVKANFFRLMQAVERGMPTPFGAASNRRSMVYVENLADLLMHCIFHPRAAGMTFLASDGIDLSIKELVALMAKAHGSRILQMPVPPALVRSVAKLINMQGFAERLFGSLQVDIQHTCGTLDWRPPFTPEEGIRVTLSAYKAGNNKLHPNLSKPLPKR